ncbi:hypothetical protein HMPREF0476_0463 [Kingella kingae ATCC 23330]|uniref:Uncharacterized protein n=1 Tax=Kingella kingae ATCC 23330 TaxID=887327 RepID=F5S5I0_KINKI|nr:hypothetical protein HMPREF0476_0463 [Kingella kingae ATCC 23330]
MYSKHFLKILYIQTKYCVIFQNSNISITTTTSKQKVQAAFCGKESVKSSLHFI